METVEVPKTLWDRVEALFARLLPAEPPTQEPQPETQQTEEFAAAIAERDQYKAELDQMKAAQEHQARIDKFAAELKETKVEGDAELVEMLAGMPDEQSAKLVEHFKALSAQIAANDKITEQLGSDRPADADSPRGKLDQAVHAKMEADKISYQDAFEAVRKENPELIQEYVKE